MLANGMFLSISGRTNYNGEFNPKMKYQDFSDFKYVSEADTHQINVDFGKLGELLRSYGVKSNWEVGLEIRYPRK